MLQVLSLCGMYEDNLELTYYRSSHCVGCMRTTWSSHVLVLSLCRVYENNLELTCTGSHCVGYMRTTWATWS